MKVMDLAGLVILLFFAWWFAEHGNIGAFWILITFDMIVLVMLMIVSHRFTNIEQWTVYMKKLDRGEISFDSYRLMVDSVFRP